MSFNEIIEKHSKDWNSFRNGGDLSDSLMDKFYSYFVNNGEMPYGTAKARTGDPHQWICDRLENFIKKHIDVTV